MKTLKLLFPLLLIGVLFTACDEDEVTLQQEPATEDVADSENIDDIDGLYFEALVEDPTSVTTDCPVITFAAPRGTFPNTVTIDFGDACTGPNGHVRSGIITIDMTDALKNTGAVHTTTYDNYYVDGVQVIGTKTVTNEGLNAENQPFFTKVIDGGGLVFPDGSNMTYNASFTRTKIAGDSTRIIRDDIFAIEGSRQGTNRNGVTFSAEVIEPLIVKRNCPWIVQGVILYTFDGQTRQIDFGDGNCDRIAEVTNSNGETRTIRIRKRWRN